MSHAPSGAGGPGDAPRAGGARWRRAAGAWHVWLPCLLLVAAAWPCIGFQMPGTEDTITESHEPIKTLRFLYQRGDDAFKWGPAPNFVFAFVYGPMLAWWKLSGQLGELSTDFPYGLPRPHEQIGAMLVGARLVVLGFGAASVAALAWTLGVLMRSRWIAFLSVSVFVACCWTIVVAFGSTKPDGLMLAFAGGALSLYAWIVYRGLTFRTGIAMSVLAVLSLSCKELTPPMFVLPYLGLAVDGLWRHRADPDARRRFVRDYAACLAAGPVTYLLVNVIYAPGAWVERMQIVVGPLKDPEIWAASSQSTASYAMDAVRALLINLGYPGTAIAAGAALASILLRPPRIALLWLPMISFLGIVVPSAGYLPPFFLVPVGMTLALPVAAAARAVLDRAPGLAAGAPGTAVRVAGVLVVGLGLWAGAGLCRVHLHSDYGYLIERYAVGNLDRSTTIYPMTFWTRNPGSSRLAWLGYPVDDRSLYDVMKGPRDRLPRVLFISEEELRWMADFENRPARARMMEAGGGDDYSGLPGPEALGYRRVAEILPELSPGWHGLWLVPFSGRFLERPVYVYRLDASEAPVGS